MISYLDAIWVVNMLSCRNQYQNNPNAMGYYQQQQMPGYVPSQYQGQPHAGAYNQGYPPQQMYGGQGQYPPQMYPPGQYQNRPYLGQNPNRYE